MNENPLRLGIVGLGGYAGDMAELAVRRMRTHPEQVRLCVVCEPDAAKIAAKRPMLDAAGVGIVRDYAALLAQDIEAVWLPLPIHLHRGFTEQAFAAGKGVLCEKPAAGSIQDVDAMIAARDRANRPAAIGFPDLYSQANWRIKEALIAGAIGTIRSASVLACWPRDSSYFGRNNWAGKLMCNGVYVMDSPANNAMAHYIHLPLFWLGKKSGQSAEPQSVHAELYRANSIENYDTCCMRIQTADATLIVHYTHACRQTIGPIIEIRGDNGLVRYQNENLELQGGAGTIARWPVGDSRAEMLEQMAGFFRGDAGKRVATLEMARAHALVVSGASQAAPIVSIGKPFAQKMDRGEGRSLTYVDGIEAALQQASANGQLLDESGLLPWTQPARGIDLRRFHKLELGNARV